MENLLILSNMKSSSDGHLIKGVMRDFVADSEIVLALPTLVVPDFPLQVPNVNLKL